VKEKILNLRNVLIAIGISAFFYIIFMLCINGISFIITPKAFVLILSFLILAMSFKGIRWLYLLNNACSEKIDYFKSLIIHFSSFSFIITPGKAGDVLKSWMMKKSCGTSHSEVLPVIFMERITDIISLSLLSFLWFFKYGKISYFVFIILFISLGFFLLTNEKILGFLNRKFLKTKDALHVLKELSNFKIVFISSFLDTLAWIFDAFIFLIILDINGVKINIFIALSMYAFSILLGALSFIPGGLGSTEIIMAAILKEYLNLNDKLIFKIVLETRFYTLWLSIFIGLIFLLIYKNFEWGILS